MSFVQLSKIWTTVGLCCIFFTLNSWISVQGGEPIFGSKLLHSGRVPTAWIGIAVSATLVIVTCIVGMIYARRSVGRWHNKIPIVAFETINTGSAEGKFYQGFFLVLFTLAPLAAIIHFWRVVGEAKVVLRGAAPRQLSSAWDTTGMFQPAMMCSELRDKALECINGVSIDPVFMPSGWAAVTLVATGVIISQWWLVLKPARNELSAG